jgi:hypothetical protein
MKLRTKIQLFSSLFMLILILLVNTSIYFLFYKITSDSELEQLAQQTNDLVSRLNENPETDVSGLIEAYLPSNGMIRIIDENGEQLMEQMRAVRYRELPGEFTNQESHEVVSQPNGADIAVVTKPIIWNAPDREGEIMTLQVSNHLVHLEETMRTLFYVLVVASIIMLLPIVVAGRVLGKFLLNPINTLIRTMKENMQPGKWEKINVDNRSRDELYEMEKTFNEMIDQLKANFEKQEEFVSNASHELRTPIQIVKSYAQLLKRQGMEREDLFFESIDAIDTESDRMKKLVEQMLNLAKNQQKEAFEPFDLVGLVEETVTTFQGAYHRDIRFHREAKQLPVNGNPDQLEQVLYILIDNAVKYSSDQIEIQLSKQNGQAQVTVKDYGDGISEEDQQRIFDRFYRVDKARSRETGGTGLGLAIAKTIAAFHRGDVTVESNKREGSAFTLRLPLGSD